MPNKTTSYYDDTAINYDMLHGGDQDLEHIRALERGWPLISSLAPDSIADIGCGTGRSMQWVHACKPSIELIGVDPSQSLLDIASKRLPSAKLKIGQGEKLPLSDNSVDICLATGIMHHVDHPALVIGEMFRVARKAVLISDHNNFAFGSTLARKIRLILYTLGLLKVATFVKQGFKRQGYSVEDGWWYPYSLFENHVDISKHSEVQYIIPTREVNSKSIGNILLIQSHFAVLAIKTASEQKRMDALV